MFIRWLFFIVCYTAATVVGRSALLPETGLSLFWPAAGISAWWAITSRSRAELIVLSASIATASTIVGAFTGASLVPAFFYALANVTVALIARFAGGWLVAAIPSLGVDRDDPDPVPNARMSTVADVNRLLATAVIAASASAAVGMVGLATSGVMPTGEAALAWVVRYSTAIIVVTAPALAVRSSGRVRRWPSAVEITTLLVVSVLVQWLVFRPDVALPISFIPICLLFWSGFRMPMPVASVHGAFVALSTLALVLRGAGGALGDVANPGMRALVVQGYMVVVAVLALLVSAALTERRQLTSTLRKSERQARLQAAQLRTIVDTVPGGLVVFDRQRHLLVRNDAISHFLTIKEVDGQPVAASLPMKHLDGRDVTVDEFPSVIALGGKSVSDMRVRTSDPSTREPKIFSISSAPLLSAEQEQPEYAVLLFHDVTAEHEQVEELRRAHEQAERLFADAPHGLALLDADGHILKANSGLGALAGVPESALTGHSLLDLGDGDGAELRDYLARTIAGQGALTTTDWRLHHSGGQPVYVSLGSRALCNEDHPEILVNVIDVSERRRYERRLAHLADHDALTGLANRRQFDHALEAHLDRCERSGPRGALLLIDLDHFKELNDTFGHAAGDHLLTSVGRILRSSFRRSDVVARLGGDEFAVLLSDADQAVAEAKAAALVHRIETEASSPGQGPSRITASVGVVTFAAAARRGADPMALGDSLLYDAKDAGRNGYVVLAEDDRDQSRTGVRMAWKDRLVRALADGLFELHLQPIYDVRAGRVAGAEALVRLADGGELVHPGRFIYIAERAGLIAELDAWVIRNAVPMLGTLRQYAGDFEIGVNISARSLGNALIEDALTDVIEQIGVRRGELIVEITETAAVQDITVARDFADRMRDLGVEIALDDFGAGFGSFHYLKHISFDWVKVDGEFVANAHRDPRDLAMLRSIVGLANDLGVRTVAEWVSSPAAMDVARELGMDAAQGFAIGAPVPLEDFVARYLSGEVKHQSSHDDVTESTGAPTGDSPDQPRLAEGITA
ncbi:EAL domain-containing protein [Epidermidibacterium keratini]|uniref:EAL domain-containing protein n=1 Tax=Epidermidibacterium keratini TaxID=1891644 RepID=A0A7L4YJP7_9ACTN|nr:EAL domain-containing protein [Epidermidibacterium keratini]QHB99038.1 EAL domain-containing protein [Epidermidibacterium keratini]